MLVDFGISFNVIFSLIYIITAVSHFLPSHLLPFLARFYNLAEVLSSQGKYDEASSLRDG